MRKVISYLFLVVTFLAVVFVINGIRFDVEKHDNASDQKLFVADQANQQDRRNFDTHLPVVIIDTGGQRIEKDKETWAKVSVINRSNSKDPSNNTPDFTADAVIKYRGSSSYQISDKKQYRLEFRQGSGKTKNKNYPVMGMSAASDWVLNAPFIDRSLVRNRLIYQVSREILSWAPDTRYFELYLDGKYEGLYLMIEPVTNGKGRLNLADFGLVSGQTAYVLERCNDIREEYILDTYGTQNGKTNYQLAVRFPTPQHLTKTQFQWIENDINRFERVLYSDAFDNRDFGYAKYIDVNSFVDYYIINEFTLTTDAGSLSTFMYKDLGGKLKITVWDFDNAFNNYVWGTVSTDQFYVAQSNWFNRLFRDRKFTDAVVARYRELRKGVLSEKHLLGLEDENTAYLGDTIDRNFTLWGYTFQEKLLSSDENGNNRDPHSYEEAIKQLKTCIIARGNFLDKNIESLYQYAIN